MKASLSTRLDRACALGPRSSALSYSQNGTPFMSLIPIAVTRNEDRRYPPVSDSEDTFDPVAILKNRLERGNMTVATRRALEIMDSSDRPGLNEFVGGAVEAPVKLVISGPDAPVEDWSDDFELGSPNDVNVSILFPSASDRSLLDEVERDSPILPKFSIKFPSTPVLDPVTPDSPCSPFILLPKFSSKLPSTPVLNPVTLPSPCSPFTLGTPALSTNWENSRSSISTLMAESPPPSPILSPANITFDEEDMARIMHTVLTRTSHPFSGSPESVDAATVMRVEIASTLAARRTGTLVGLGVAMPVIYPPLPPTLFPLRELRAVPTALNSRRVFSLRSLGYQSFDDGMFEIEQTSSALLSRNVHDPREPCGLDFEINESLLYSPLQGCTAPTPLLPADFDCSDSFQVEQTLLEVHTTINHTSPIAFGKALVGLGLGLGILTEASVESQPLPSEPSPTTGMQKHSQSLKKYN